MEIRSKKKITFQQSMYSDNISFCRNVHVQYVRTGGNGPICSALVTVARTDKLDDKKHGNIGPF